MPEGRDDESGLAPPLESPTQRMNTLEAVGGQAEGHPCARCLFGLRAVEDHFAVSWDQLVRMPQRFGRDPAGSRDSVRSRLHVQRRSQVDDHEVIARVQPSLELRGGDASLPEVTEEAPPSDVLEHEVGDEHSRDADDNRRPEAGDTGCDEKLSCS